MKITFTQLSPCKIFSYASPHKALAQRWQKKSVIRIFCRRKIHIFSIPEVKLELVGLQGSQHEVFVQFSGVEEMAKFGHEIRACLAIFRVRDALSHVTSKISRKKHAADIYTVPACGRLKVPGWREREEDELREGVETDVGNLGCPDPQTMCFTEFYNIFNL